MKKVIYLLLIGGAIFICPHQSKAEPYYLARSFNHHHQSIPSNSKAPARVFKIRLKFGTFFSRIIGLTN